METNKTATQMTTTESFDGQGSACIICKWQVEGGTARRVVKTMAAAKRLARRVGAQIV